MWPGLIDDVPILRREWEDPYEPMPNHDMLSNGCIDRSYEMSMAIYVRIARY